MIDTANQAQHRPSPDVQRTPVRLGWVLLDAFIGSPGGAMHAHGMDAPHVCLLCAGSLKESRRRGEAVIRHAGSARISPADDAHDVRFGEAGTRCLMVRFAGDVDDLRPATPCRVTTAEAPLLAEIARDLEEQLRAPSSVSVLCAAERSLELFAVMCRRSNAQRSSVMPAWLDRIRDRIRDTPAHPPALEELAKVARSHPAHLIRAFKQRFGCTPGEYARRTRAIYAARLLDTTALGLAAVASAAGFCDQPHMNREFRRLADVTPGALRSASARGELDAHRIQDAPVTLG